MRASGVYNPMVGDVVTFTHFAGEQTGRVIATQSQWSWVLPDGSDHFEPLTILNKYLEWTGGKL